MNRKLPSAKPELFEISKGMNQCLTCLSPSVLLYESREMCFFTFPGTLS